MKTIIRLQHNGKLQFGGLYVCACKAFSEGKAFTAALPLVACARAGPANCNLLRKMNHITNSREAQVLRGCLYVRPVV